MEVFTEILVNSMIQSFHFFYPLKIVAFLSDDSWKAKIKYSSFVYPLSYKTHLLVLKNDFPHAEVEHGADVDDEQHGADHGEGEDGGPGGTRVGLRHGAEHLLAGARPVDGVHLVVRH